MKLQENTVFDGRYELLRLLGRGGFSEVWLAKDQWTHLNVAIKVYAPGQGMEEDGMNEFCGELAGIYDINHSNLLKPQHVDSWENMPYLIMAYCPNGSCAKLVGKATEEQMWRIIHDVASGLAYLHENDVVHQDIKPANILIGENGHYLITDFGVSSRARSTLRKSVVSSTGGGTTAYMGPERFSSQPAPTKASDIWSFGAMCFELVEGDVPFGDNGGLSQRLSAEIPTINANVSDALKFTIIKMLQKETWDRPTAATLIEWAAAPQCIKIENTLQGDAARHVSTDRPTERRNNAPVAEPEGRATERHQTPVTPSDNKTTGNKRVWILVGVLAAVIVVLCVLLLGGRSESTDDIDGEELIVEADTTAQAVMTDTLAVKDTVAEVKVDSAVSTVKQDTKETPKGLTKTVNGVVIKDGVLKKVPKSFRGHFVIEDGVTSIGYRAFEGCAKLTGVTIPNSVTSIGELAFLDCGSLESISIPNGVTSIGARAFYSCYSLKRITLPNSLKRIEYAAFHGCKSLTDVTIPNSVTRIDSSPFEWCEIPHPIYTKNIFVYMPSSVTGSYTIPYGIKTIVGGAFSNSNLTEVLIPTTVTQIRGSAFNGCRIKSIIIPSGVKSIESCTFYLCHDLEYITLPNSINKIDNAFGFCHKIKAIYVPVGSKERFKAMLTDDLKDKVVER